MGIRTGTYWDWKIEHLNHTVILTYCISLICTMFASSSMMRRNICNAGFFNKIYVFLMICRRMMTESSLYAGGGRRMILHDPPRFLKDRFGKSCQGGKQGPEGIKSEGWLQEAGEGKTLPRKGVQKQRRRRRRR